MGVLETFLKALTVKSFIGLWHEYGFLNGTLLALVICFCFTFIIASLKLTAALATAYVESCGKSCSELKGVITLAVFCTAGVIVAMGDMPYSFYMLLRVLVCLTAVVAFTKARKARLEFWKWAFGVIAALYNPFVPVHLGDKDLWTIVNIVTILLIWVGTLYIGLLFACVESSIETIRASFSRAVKASFPDA